MSFKKCLTAILLSALPIISSTMVSASPKASDGYSLRFGKISFAIQAGI